MVVSFYKNAFDIICPEHIAEKLSSCMWYHATAMCHLGSKPSSTFRVHDDVIKWKHFPRYWPFDLKWIFLLLPFMREIHWSQMNFPHKEQRRGAVIFSLICAWTNDWVNNRNASDLRRHRPHYDVTLMIFINSLHHQCVNCETRTREIPVTINLFYIPLFCHRSFKILAYNRYRRI